jgi:hypothetical protein
MERVLLLIAATATAAGCQMRSPLAAFGPLTVPAPTTLDSAPYYPSTTAQQPPPPATPPASNRLSVSAEGKAPLTRSAMAPAAADREAIRIVENPTAATRTAAVPARSTSSSAPAATPAGQQPVSRPASPPPSISSPPANPPTSRTPLRSDSAVIPAAYQQQATPAFVEPPQPAGQWRAR